jgi:hypothetical protein
MLDIPGGEILIELHRQVSLRKELSPSARIKDFRDCRGATPLREYGARPLEEGVQ